MSQNQVIPPTRGVLHYGRHFVVLACLAAAVTAGGSLRPTPGVVGSFGVYGALYAAAIAVSVRRFERRWHGILLVVVGAAISMLGAALALQLSRFLGALPDLFGPALLLALATGVGAAGFAKFLRRALRANLPPRAVVSITLGCIAAVWAVLWSGLYRHGAGSWFAASWWFAFSIGLWSNDGRSGTRGFKNS